MKGANRPYTRGISREVENLQKDMISLKMTHNLLYNNELHGCIKENKGSDATPQLRPE